MTLRMATVRTHDVDGPLMKRARVFTQSLRTGGGEQRTADPMLRATMCRSVCSLWSPARQIVPPWNARIRDRPATGMTSSTPDRPAAQVAYPPGTKSQTGRSPVGWTIFTATETHCATRSPVSCNSAPSSCETRRDPMLRRRRPAAEHRSPVTSLPTPRPLWSGDSSESVSRFPHCDTRRPGCSADCRRSRSPWFPAARCRDRER